MTKTLDKKSLALFIIGIVLIVVAVVAWGTQNQRAQAATGYSFTWIVKTWRNIPIPNSGPGNTAATISLGPAEWTVTGGVTGSTTTITETWTVPSGSWSGNVIAGATNGAFTSFNTPATFVAAGQNCAAVQGLYSAVGGQIVSGSGCNEKANATAYVQIPNQWTVTGTIAP
mgnify:CR=1 FL=1